jgi:predicted peptidase
LSIAQNNRHFGLAEQRRSVTQWLWMITPTALFQKHQAEDPAGHRVPYRLLPPKGPEAGRSYPLLLFLHGAGERGEENERQLIHGGATFLADAFRERFPCWVLAPQCPLEDYWVRIDWRRGEGAQPREISPHLQMILEVIERLRAAGEVDAARIYVMGLSMGGFGTWDLVTRFPGLFAAAVPICGGGDPRRAAWLRDLPLWVFHGAEDTVVPPDHSRRMVRAIEAAGGKPRYTEYPGVGHNSWDPAFAEPELFSWLFAQKKG